MGRLAEQGPEEMSGIPRGAPSQVSVVLPLLEPTNDFELDNTKFLAAPFKKGAPPCGGQR